MRFCFDRDSITSNLKFSKNRDEEDRCHKNGGNKESSYITHHNRQSDSTFLIEFGQGLSKNVELD